MEKKLEKFKAFLNDPDVPGYAKSMETYWIQHTYNKSEHPVPVWEAISLCCQEGLYFPPWVRKYLENASERLLAVDEKKAKYPPAVLKALHIKRPAFTRRNKHFPEEIGICMGVEALKKEIHKPGGGKLTDRRACELYAKSIGQKFHPVYDIYRKSKNNPLYGYIIEE